MAGTRFTKAAVPQAGSALNVSSRIIGANPRKQKLTEASGTNPSKLGALKLDTGKSSPSKSSYAQDTAPHKQTSVEYPFGVGGPGFTDINLKGFK